MLWNPLIIYTKKIGLTLNTNFYLFLESYIIIKSEYHIAHVLIQSLVLCLPHRSIIKTIFQSNIKTAQWSLGLRLISRKCVIVAIIYRPIYSIFCYLNDDEMATHARSITVHLWHWFGFIYCCIRLRYVKAI